MRPLRRIALAVVVLDCFCGVAALCMMGGSAVAVEVPAPSPEIRYIATVDGCGMLLARGEGVWRYEGLVDPALCITAPVSLR